jgi:hypothetical protein
MYRTVRKVFQVAHTDSVSLQAGQTNQLTRPSYRYCLSTSRTDQPANPSILPQFHYHSRCHSPSVHSIQIVFCFSGIPVALSFPHFLKGDPRLHEMMDGLSPDPTKHEFVIVIQPVS